MKDIKKKKKRTIFTGPDFEEGLYAMALVAQGKSAKVIQNRTSYSVGMISYRSKFLKMKISDYRNNKGELAKELEKRNTDFLMKRLSGKIENKIR